MSLIVGLMSAPASLLLVDGLLPHLYMSVLSPPTPVKSVFPPGSLSWFYQQTLTHSSASRWHRHIAARSLICTYKIFM